MDEHPSSSRPFTQRKQSAAGSQPWNVIIPSFIKYIPISIIVKKPHKRHITCAKPWRNLLDVIIWTVYIYPMDPSTFLGSVWGMIWGVKCLFRRCLDPYIYIYTYIYIYIYSSTFESVCNEFEHVEQKLPKLFIKPIQHIHLDGKSILYISSLKITSFDKNFSRSKKNKFIYNKIVR